MREQRSIVNNLQNDPKVNHPRAGEAKRSFLEKQQREDAIRGLIIAVGKDKWLSAVASVAGQERALASARQYGIGTSEYESGREELVTRLTQSSVSYPGADAPSRVNPRKHHRTGTDYMDHPSVMALLVGLDGKGVRSWDSPQVQEACRQVDEEVPYVPPASEMGVPDILPQRSLTSQVVRYNAEQDDDLTATLPDQLPARRSMQPAAPGGA